MKIKRNCTCTIELPIDIKEQKDENNDSIIRMYEDGEGSSYTESAIKKMVDNFEQKPICVHGEKIGTVDKIEFFSGEETLLLTCTLWSLYSMDAITNNVERTVLEYQIDSLHLDNFNDTKYLK